MNIFKYPNMLKFAGFMLIFAFGLISWFCGNYGLAAGAFACNCTLLLMGTLA